MENSEEEISGFIYVMWNDVFQHYGENVYKVGKSQDVQKRMRSYTTSFIKPVELKYVSIKCDNYSLAEKVVFQRLANYRMVSNREFFQTDITRIIEVIEATVNDINSGVITSVLPTTKDRPHRNVIIKGILSAPDISTTEFEQIYKKHCFTEEDKYKMERYIWKLKLGVDKLDENILQKFMNERLDNFMSLFDERNIYLSIALDKIRSKYL